MDDEDEDERERFTDNEGEEELDDETERAERRLRRQQQLQLDEQEEESASSSKSRKKSFNDDASSETIENPYASDESSYLIPILVAIGAFIPLLFCLCKIWTLCNTIKTNITKSNQSHNFKADLEVEE